MEINTNISSSILQRSLNINTSEINNTIVKLSTGKDSSAIENAANLILSKQQDIKSQSSKQAMGNTQAGISMLQVAESGMSSVNENIGRIRELTLQGLNGTNGKEDLDAIKSEITQRREQIDNIAQTTTFNNIKLLDGSGKGVSIQTGINAEPEHNSSNVGNLLKDVSSENLGLPSDEELNKLFANKTGNEDIFQKIDMAKERISNSRSDIGAVQQAFGNKVESLATSAYSSSSYGDTDYAKEAMNLISGQVKQSSQEALWTQAKSLPNNALALISN